MHDLCSYQIYLCNLVGGYGTATSHPVLTQIVPIAPIAVRNANYLMLTRGFCSELRALGTEMDRRSSFAMVKFIPPQLSQ